ncbi:PepSY domain-containing protein [Burkholderia mayonis]|uniref:Uncharacterized protein n=1 Tax=Burkholderia mayonis TaxID=1385591 RepID=A0A1B4FWK6_9BURK|nr:PepSY domain-containing protein [Burkholderia mayonis]AOJ08075.1 hypothetical protein WS71_03965 [Burkholderia mayonis]KVE51285.1 hypothetical protein WS71_12880 [Burkholderia mayonis]
MSTTILGFKGRVTIAVRKVTEQYPHAKLYEVDGIASGGPTTDPKNIDKLRVVFQNESGTVIINSIGYDEFAPPVSYPTPWTGDVVIEWPVKLDLDEANHAKEAAGYKEAYDTVTVRNPLGPKRGNPFYIFGSGPDRAREFVFVDAITGKVVRGE